MSKKDFTGGLNSLLGDETAPIENLANAKKEKRLSLKKVEPYKKERQLNKSLAKWQQLEKVNVLMTAEQKEFLDKSAKRIMKNRNSKKNSERITTNTIIRSLIEVLKESGAEINASNITNEKDLTRELSELLSC